MQPSAPAALLAACRRQVWRLAHLAVSPRLRLARRVLIACIGLTLLLAVVARLAFPLFFSAGDLSSAFTAAVSRSMGAKITVAGEPDLSLWPAPVLTMPDVSFADSRNPSGVTVTARSVTIGFDVTGALFGHPDYDGVRLNQPTFTLSPNGSGADAGARDADAILRLLALLRPSDPNGAVTGDLVIEGGRLRVLGDDDASALSIDDIWGTVALPAGGTGVSGDLTGVLHGVPTTLSFRSSDAATLIRGGSAPLFLAVTSTPVTARFDGTVTISAQPFVAGSMSVSAPTVGGMARFFGLEQLARNTLGPVALEARLSTAADAIKFDGVELTLGDTGGRGVLDVSLPDNGTPMLSGTLAFDRIDLSSMLPVIGGLQVERSYLGAAIEDQLTVRVRTDLRLSAETVQFSSLTATRVAAGLRGAPGRLSLDIGDATVADGRLSGTLLVAAPPGEETRGSVDIHVRDADMQRLATAFNLGGPMTEGRAAISLALQSPDPILLAPAQSLTGHLTIRSGAGRISGLAPATLTQNVKTGGAFSLSSVADGSMPFDMLDIAALLDRGRLNVQYGRLVGSAGSLDLRGMIDMPTSGLALAGRYDPQAVGTASTGSANGAAEPRQPLTTGARFFVGGTWPQAVITPLSVLTPDQ
ncbi:AsmA protein [Rhizobium sp. RU20A]|uniref:AsmA family protein n=1 Tax=Rhizobium sp. RU20A TaxID=1907412 RepID=UPI000956FE44|nr:AsmA-like C-terminal region-containing protein [Rhizobium sp. RU20A]SIQ53817.1 AsmA protein [Rhizobium sp. RU20A]